MPKEEMPVPYDALALLQQGRIRSLNDVVDLAAEIGGALLRKEIGTTTARELRQWAELMYTGIQAQQSDDGASSTNIIAQLVQIAGTEPPKVMDVPEPAESEWEEAIKTMPMKQIG